MLKQIIEFTKLLQQFREIKRAMVYATSDVPENDAEHSFQLAMIAWYIIETKKLSLDINKVLKYALVHDLVEVYAGDTIPFDPKSAGVITKKEREHQALLRIEKEFPEANQIFNWINDYEGKSNEEARFVYALDKIIPEFTIILGNGKSWRLYDVGRSELKTHMEKSKIHPDVYDICQEIFEQLDAHPEWFKRL